MNSPKLILWIIWVSLLSFIVYYRFAYGAEMPEEEPLNIIFVILISCVLFGSLTCRVLVLPRQDNPFAFFVGGLAAARRCYVAWCLVDSILSGLGISYVCRLYGDLFAIFHKSPQYSGWGKGILGYDLLNGVSTFNPNQTFIQPSVEIGKIVRIETKLV